MPHLARRAALIVMLAVLAACGRAETVTRAHTDLYPNETPQLREMIVRYSTMNEVPVDLVQRVVVRESTHNPRARNGPYFGLMQILPQTARTMGYKGPPEGLLDAETNLKYAVRYLRGAWMVSDGDIDRAVMWYAKGYYYEAKRRGLLEETGLKG